MVKFEIQVRCDGCGGQERVWPTELAKSLADHDLYQHAGLSQLYMVSRMVIVPKE